jgi:predicted ATP-grasp superfamily ATP-dependent carboligase
LAAAHATIIEQVRTLRPDILMPVFDPGWSVIYEYHEEYAHLTTIVPNPGRDLFEDLLDKGRLADYAEKHGVSIPKTFRPLTLDEAIGLKTHLSFPMLLKPPKSVSGVGIQRVDSVSDFVAALKRSHEIPIIQEYIEGEDLELTILCNYGEPIAGSEYLSIRNAPLPYGPPVACRTIQDDTLMGIGTGFLRKIGYHGVAHLDFRRDQRDGQPKLLDFNARLAGTNEISLFSGVDFAFMLYQLALGETVDPRFDYNLGIEFRWIMPGELRHFLQTDRKWQTAKELLKWRKVGTEISLRDPLPHVMMAIDGFRRLFGKITA